MSFTRIAAIAAAMAVALGAPAAAQGFPNKPVKMVVPFPPGGTSDFVGRVISEAMGKSLGQPVIVENRAGAAGAIGTVGVSQAAPDGYTVLLTSSDVTITPIVQPNAPFDPVSDFAPVGLVLRYSHYLVANPALPVKTVGDLIALAKSKPGEINFASGGIGGSNHMAAERFQSHAGVKLTHVPYSGNGPAITDLVANRVQLLWTSLPPVQAFVTSGKLKILGITSKARAAATPEVPTFSESGMPGYELNNWFGMLAPAKTPPEVVDRLNAALKQAMASPEVLTKLATLGAEPAVNTPAEFGQMLKDEMVSWREVAKQAGIAAK
ncbi:Bug family tripartite tricarboxylate transporter substrate binding protein [Bosea sp. (in: a-proteobacteria)]|uniref:Bug family tripartite tricarboxylate transporter substrate binding protein n=1 Tax=Bosea sp. (in: a-proteobacteria) TaxID=1871050 RepID=UPI002FC5D526